VVEPADALTPAEVADIAARRKDERAKLDAMAPTESGGHAAPTTRSLARSEGGAAEGDKKPSLDPPFKYPNSSEAYRPDYLDKVDALLLRAMESFKTLPELHYQLSRVYRHTQANEDEKRALAAADAYFQRLEPRKTRLNNRPALRVATSNRIGEVFDEAGQPLQAEKYYLDARKNFEAAQAQGLVTFDLEAARLYRNLGNLYYHQTPGVDAAGKGTTPGGWAQALSLYETAEKGHWEEPAVEYRLGVIQYEKRDFAAAIKRFFALDRPGNRGESSGRTNPNLLYSMGNALFRSGNYASAEGYYRELLSLLREKRSRITDFDPVGRAAHKALAQRLYETWNNLAAAQYRASNAFRAGTPEFREAIASLTTARAQAQILGRDLYEDKSELDITMVDDKKLQAIRDDQAKIVAKTRQEKGLVEANLQVLSMIETVSPSRKAALANQLEIFARIPLELDQTQAP
jgi:quinol monooxygenase YgiN